MIITEEAVAAAAKAWSERAAQPGSWTIEESARVALEAVSQLIAAETLEAAALEFELSPHNAKAKMARHFNNAYVNKLRLRAESLRAAL